MRWRIQFTGKLNGSLHALFPDFVTRYVDAATSAEARMRAYETHEHIPGGADGVKATEVCKLGCARDNEGMCHVCGKAVDS